MYGTVIQEGYRMTCMHLGITPTSLGSRPGRLNYRITFIRPGLINNFKTCLSSLYHRYRTGQIIDQ